MSDSMTAQKSLVVALSVALAVYACPAQALDTGCGTITDMSQKLVKEGQVAFAKGRRLSTPEENKALYISQPVLFGFLVFSSSDGSRGYIAKTEKELELGPTNMCIDHVIGNIRPNDVRERKTQEMYARWPLLADYLNSLAIVDEQVLFQANSLKKSKKGYEPDGTIITATANMLRQDESHKGRGTVFFTSANGNTSRIYSTSDNVYTKTGLGVFKTLTR